MMLPLLPLLPKEKTIMNIKEQAYQLFRLGYSYSEIAVELSISKSSAHSHVKQIKMLNMVNTSTPVQNSSGKGLNVRSVQKMNEQRTNGSLESNTFKNDKLKEFTGDELLEKEFIIFDFIGKFLELIGKPSKPFAGIIWGLPKSGKSNLAIRFADYLCEYFGSVCYIAAEEGESATLQSKVKDIGGSSVIFIEIKDKDEIRAYLKKRQFDFVFIDSINNACISHDFLELLKTENPSVSFVAIVQATKSGDFKGGQALAHNCDFIIKVVDGIAYQEGRFNNASEMAIFTEPLYQKNPLKSLPVPLEPIIKAEVETTNTQKAVEEKKETVPKVPIDFVKSEQLPSKIQAPISTIKKAMQPPIDVANSAALWFLGTIVFIAVIDGLSKSNKVEENK